MTIVGALFQLASLNKVPKILSFYDVRNVRISSYRSVFRPVSYPKEYRKCMFAYYPMPLLIPVEETRIGKLWSPFDRVKFCRKIKQETKATSRVIKYCLCWRKICKTASDWQTLLINVWFDFLSRDRAWSYFLHPFFLA